MPVIEPPSTTPAQRYTQEEWLAHARKQPQPRLGTPQWAMSLRRKVLQEGMEVNGHANTEMPTLSPHATPPRHSAVLILISGQAHHTAPTPPEDATLLLTHRCPSMRQHSGQVAFPGGRREPEDNGPIATALREAVEETGLDPDGVQPLAILPQIYIARTNNAVTPVLAYWEKPTGVYPATPENDWVAAVPLVDLINPQRRFTVGFQQWTGPAFAVEDKVMWGFTASVITALLHRAGWEQPWGRGCEPVSLFEALQRSTNGEALDELIASFTHADN